MEDWIELASGRQLLFTRPPEEMQDCLSLEDIAHGLSQMCRYAGQCQRFYSVAEHSALLAQEAFFDTTDALFALACLMHDASEAFLPDIPRPMKVYLPDYLRLEASLMAAVSLKWALGPFIWPIAADCDRSPFPYEKVAMDPRIKDYDSRILVNERAAIMGDSGHSWSTDGLEPLKRIKIECLPPDRAKQLFLATFEALHR
jgi:hypothetical protein